MATTNQQVDILQGLLATCTPAQAASFIQALQIVVTPAPNVANSMTTQKVTKTGTKSGSKKAKRDSAPGGPKRPLNSWMAFRKFYSASLAPHTQKAISKILTAWWRADPFEAKWAMLAKGYSIVRGTLEKEKAPLDEYFSLVAPVIGVISPRDYQTMMGWQLTPSNDGSQVPQIIRTFVPDISTFDTMYTSTTFSVDDLVAYCRDQGYDSGVYLDSMITPAINSDCGALTMAVQPTTTTTPAMPVMLAPQTTVADLEVVTPTTQAIFDRLGTELALELVEPNGQATLNEATVAVSNAGVYPYNNLFDPNSNFNVSFNPAEENSAVDDGGKWDAYDLTASDNVYDETLDFNFSQFVEDALF